MSNTGGAGTYQAELEINGAVVDAKDVTVPSADSRTATFYVTRDEPGTYNVQLGDRRGSFTVAHPPLNVMLDYVGVKFDHNMDGPGEIYLLVLAYDGEQQMEHFIPLEGGWEVSDYDTESLGRSVFTTGSVGDYFDIAILAYHRVEQGSSWGTIGLLVDIIFPELGGLGSKLGGIIDAINAQAPECEYIGSYQAMWSDYDSWGIGEHNCVGEDDLRLWFRIWSDSPQQPVVQPTVGLPNVFIQDVDMPSTVTAAWCDSFFCGPKYDLGVTLKNMESYPVQVTLKHYSSFYPDNITTWHLAIPANGAEEIAKKALFYLPGTRIVTWELMVGEHTLDSYSATIVAEY